MSTTWKNDLATRTPGHGPGQRRAKPPGTLATRRALSHGQEQMMKGLATGHAPRWGKPLRSQAGKAPATLHDFLAQSAAADLGRDGAVRTALGQLHLTVEDPVTLRRYTLLIDHDAIRVTADVVAGLQGAPEAEQSGVRALDLTTQHAQRGALVVLDGTLDWAGDRVRLAKSILETWQSQAQQAIAVALWEGLLAAPTPVERMALVQDAGEVFDFEGKLLEKLAADEQSAAAKLGHLQSQIDAAGQEVLFLRTMQDLRAGRPVPNEVLREMAQYYAERGDSPLGAAQQGSRRQTPRGSA